MTSEQIEIVNNIKFSIIKAIDNIESEQMWEMIEKAYEQKEKEHCEDYLKKRDKDYVHYNVKWLLDNWEQELELLSGGKIKTYEDCISRAQALHACCDEWDKDYKAIMKSIRQLPSVTPKADSKWGSIGNNTDLETVPTNLQDWLSTFNTESATECFTAVQQLKERVNE